MLSPRQELILKLVVDAYLASGRPVPSKEIAERAEVEWGPSTVRAELAALEAAGYLTHPHTSAGRVPTEFGYRLLRRFADGGRRRRRCRRSRSSSRAAPRDRRGDAGDDGGAGPGDRPDGAGHGAAGDGRGDDPPGRGAAPAADPGDGGRDRLQRRRRQARLRLPRSGRPRPGRVGLELPERVACRDERRRADDRQPARRPRAGAGRGRVRRHSRRGLHRARAGGERRHPLHGGRLAAALRSPLRRPAPGRPS